MARNLYAAALLLGMIVVLAPHAPAQDAPAAAVNPPPALKLSPAQRQLIYASISRQTHKSTAAPPTFGASVGVHVPEAIELAALPETIVEIVPQTRGYAYAFVSDQVLLVEPKGRRIVEIISRS